MKRFRIVWRRVPRRKGKKAEYIKYKEVARTLAENRIANYNKLYGSIGTLIVIMLWIYYNALILIIGFELNASIDNAKSSRRNF